MGVERLIEIRQKECRDFLNIIESYPTINEYIVSQSFGMLPFRDSKDIYAEVSCIEETTGVLIGSNYSYLVGYLANATTEEQEYLNFFLEAIIHNRELTVCSFTNTYNRDWRLIDNRAKYANENFMYLKFINLFETKPESSVDIQNRSETVGITAEYIVNNKLSKDSTPYIWTARDIGDGFGYDFATSENNLTSKAIEVKGRSGSTTISLTDNEKAVLSNLEQYSEDKYHIYLVNFVEVDHEYNLIKYNMYDFYYINNLLKVENVYSNQELIANEIERYKVLSIK